MSEDLTPLGALLEAARERMKPKLSQNAAAKKAGTSGTTWRRVIKGVARFGGIDVPFDGAADSIARMAQVVGVTPEQLEEHDRADAAEELRALLYVEPKLPTTPQELAEHVERRLAEQDERQDAKIAAITEALRSVLGDDVTEKLLERLDETSEEPPAEEPPAEEPPGKNHRRNAG